MARILTSEESARMATSRDQQRVPVDSVTDSTDHAARFLRQLSWELNRRGIAHTVKDHEVVVEGVAFDAWCRNGIKTIQFCEKRWNAGSRPYRYDVSAVADELLQQLPERKKYQEAYKKRKAAEQQADMVPRIRGLKMVGTWEGELELRFQHPDKATILAAMDCLTEAGFIDDQAPRHTTPTYVVVATIMDGSDGLPVPDFRSICYGPFLQKWKAEAVAVKKGGSVVELQEPV